MENKQFDNENFVLYSPDTLKYITDNLEFVLNKSYRFYKELFEIENFRKIQINYFDDKDKFREYIYSLRGEKTSLPEYAIGTFDNGMINAYIFNDIKDEKIYQKRLYLASHELFHIMYRELILEKEKIKRITWFDEGMAQLFSNEYKITDEFINNIIINTKEIPNLNDLDHGTNFITDNYNGYKLSLLAVKHLYDTLESDEFKSLMKDEKRIKECGNNILNDIIENKKGCVL